MCLLFKRRKLRGWLLLLSNRDVLLPLRRRTKVRLTWEAARIDSVELYIIVVTAEFSRIEDQEARRERVKRC